MVICKTGKNHCKITSWIGHHHPGNFAEFRYPDTPSPPPMVQESTEVGETVQTLIY